MRKSAGFLQVEIWNKDLKPGDTCEGQYIKHETFKGRWGESHKYIIETEGKKFGVFGSASLDAQFGNVPEGSYVWIEYKGEEQSKNGRPVKVYAVDYDDEYKA